MRKKLIQIIILVAAIAGASTYYVKRYGSRPDDTALNISGNIEAHESVVGFKVQGRIVELPVEEGQQVKTGDLLARLDQNDYRQQVRMDEAAMETREAELKLSLAGSRSQEKKAAKQSLIDAQADLELKKLDYQRNQALFEKDEVSAQTRDTAATNLKRAQAIFERNRQNYNQVMEGVRKEQIAIDKSNLISARKALELSKIKLDYTSLEAPTSGVALVRQAEIGEVVSPGTPVVTIADLDHIWLRGYISETDLGKVRLGQAVAIKTDTYPGKTYKGRISFISSEAEFTPKSVETLKERVTLVYRVKIDLGNPNHELKPGMPADASIAVSPSK
jgi:HlyD family secretion protein